MDLPVSAAELSYIVAHKGLFQRAPLAEHLQCMDEPGLWRAALDRALLDYIKGPEDVGQKEFSEVSAWLYDVSNRGDFSEVCNLACMDEVTVFGIFQRFRYKE